MLDCSTIPAIVFAVCRTKDGLIVFRIFDGNLVEDKFNQVVIEKKSVIIVHLVQGL